MGYNKSECALLGTKHPDNETANLEKLVQPHATIIKMVHTLLDAFFSAFACFFVGPWTDHFGRKPVLIATTIGNYYLLRNVKHVSLTLYHHRASKEREN